MPGHQGLKHRPGSLAQLPTALLLFSTEISIYREFSWLHCWIVAQISDTWKLFLPICISLVPVLTFGSRVLFIFSAEHWWRTTCPMKHLQFSTRPADINSLGKLSSCWCLVERLWVIIKSPSASMPTTFCDYYILFLINWQE